MRKLLIDTEFIRATKERVHFIEVALLDVETGKVVDYHFDAKLNNWEHRYFTRALNGHYGVRTQAVFEAVNALYSGEFDTELVDQFCMKNKFDYSYKKMRHVKALEPVLSNCELYAWDISNDKDLFKQITPNNFELIDVQQKWKQKFGGNQLSLIDAYKHTLYNSGHKDFRNLIEYAHYACCDVMLLEKVMSFIENHEGELFPIPVMKSVRDKKVIEHENNIVRWKQNIEELNQLIDNAIESDEMQLLSKKLVRHKQKISKASNNKERLLNVNVYEQPWW